MKQVTLSVSGMKCDHCAATVQQALEAVDGVQQAEVSLEASTANLLLEDGVLDRDLVAAVETAGFQAIC